MPDSTTHPPLLPCPVPWCGSQDVELYSLWSQHNVWCRTCELHGPLYADADTAARAWNTRTTDPATLALARLGAACLHDGTRHPVHFWKEVTLALHTPGVRERIAELLGDTTTTTEEQHNDEDRA
jgi:hypothetical protein